MNKKFSTLMAGLMLASAFSVASAQTPWGKYENGKYYMLGAVYNGTLEKYISVESDSNADYGKLDFVGAPTNLEETREALWKVTVTQESYGDTPKYSFVNVATGQVLSVAIPKDDQDVIGDDEDVMISGGFMEWYNGLNSVDIDKRNGNKFMSYISKNEVVYLVKDANNKINVKRGTVAEAETSGVSIIPVIANKVTLGAEELNKELIMNNALEDDDTFTLSFNRDVTEGAAKNLFSSTPLRAKQVYRYIKTGSDPIYSESTTTPTGYTPDSNYGKYVRLYSKDNGYIVVDTMLHKGSEAEKQLPMFTYDDPDKENVDGNNVNRLPESFNFKFAYDPTNNRVLIKVEKYVKKLFNTNSNKPAKITGADGNEAYTYWPTTNYTNVDGNTVTLSATQLVSDAYVRLVELSNVRELTVASAAADGTNAASGLNEWTTGNYKGADDLELGMLTTVTIGQGLMSYEPTTIPTGLYLIQYKGANKGAGDDAVATDNYYVANLGGAFGYAEQAVRQAYDHMPAAQWYVEQQGTIATAPVTITNREFFDNVDNLAYTTTTNDDVFGANVQYQAFKAPDGNYFFLSGAFARAGMTPDTLKFIPVSAASKADSLLGYKHVDAEQASVEVYNFNYLHGLSLDNGLNTPSDKDSLVRVDETGEKAAFRLVPVVEHDSYGMQLSAADVKATGIANLIRNAYYVKAYDNSKFEGDRYLKYDEPSKKYVMSTTPVPYFLKENNCIDGKHYYALVEAELLYMSLDGVYDKLYGTTGNTNPTKLTFYAPEYAGKSVKEAKTYAQIYKDLQDSGANPQTLEDYLKYTYFYPLSNAGQPVVEDASKVALYAYQADSKNETVVLRRIYVTENNARVYGTTNKAKNEKAKSFGDFQTKHYADARVSVDDNTLDLTQAVLEDKWEAEIRVSAFDVKVIDNPLYRRFNGAAPETYGTSANAPLNLKFFRFNNDAEYLFENYSSANKYRDGLKDNSISFLGVNNAYQFEENETRSYTMYVDTAYVRNNTRMPQYLIAVKPEFVEGDTTLCDASTHQHATPEEALACEHTQIKVGFTRAMYLFNAQDSIDAANYDYQGKAAYGAQGYTRLAFKDAVHAGDTLYILNPGVTTDQLKATDLKDGDLFADKIFLGDNKHKNVVFSFRLIDSDNNRFLIESESEENGAAVLNKDLSNVSIAPMAGGWVKVQNGVPVIARYQDFNEAIAQADVFDVNDEIKYDAVDNENIAVEGVSVVAGNGQVTIMGAAGKNVTITNILGKVIANQTIASDNATIAVPAGIVAVAVEGEAAVKAIVK